MYTCMAIANSLYPSLSSYIWYYAHVTAQLGSMYISVCIIKHIWHPGIFPTHFPPVIPLPVEQLCCSPTHAEITGMSPNCEFNLYLSTALYFQQSSFHFNKENGKVV